MEWYYLVDGSQQGPISDDSFQALVSVGTIQATTLVWNASMSDWVEYATLDGAAPVAAAESDASAGGSRLKLVAREEAPAHVRGTEAATEAVGDDGDDSSAACSQCNRLLPVQELMNFEGHTVCVDCKPAFFGRLREAGHVRQTRGRGTGGSLPLAEITAQARAGLSGRWWYCVGTIILLGMAERMISGAMSLIPVIGMVAPLAVVGAFSVGRSRYFLQTVRQEDVSVNVAFSGFSEFGRNTLLALWVFLLIFLWGSLFFAPMIGFAVVFGIANVSSTGAFPTTLPPGLSVGWITVGSIMMVLGLIPLINRSWAYAMVWLVAADDPDLGPMECVRRSAELMRGNKTRLFLLMLRISCWFLVPVFVMVLIAGLMGGAGAGGGMGAMVAVGLIGGVAGLGCLVGLFFFQAYSEGVLVAFYDDLPDPNQPVDD